MSSEKLTTNQDDSTSEDNPLIIEINRNIGTSTDEDAVVMPKNVNQEEEIKPIENLEEVKSREKIVQDQTKDFVGTATGGTPTEIISQTTDIALKPKPIPPKTQLIFETIQAFNDKIRPYVTAKDAEEIINSNFDNSVLDKVSTQIYKRKEKDNKSEGEEGRDISLIGDALSSVRTKVAGFDPQLAEEINSQTLPNIYDNIKEYVNEDEVYKLVGIDPNQKGASNDARYALSFAVYDDKTIANQALQALTSSLPKKQRDKYLSLNYDGNKIHVDNYRFPDGKSRLIYKIPKEIGGDNQYRLFNKPGVTSEDFSGFAGELIPLTAEITAGFLTAKGGPAAVATASGLASGIGEYLKLLYGKEYLGVNQDYTDQQLQIEAIKRAGITYLGTRAIFPIFNYAQKKFKATLAQVLPEEYGGKGVLSNKVITDFVDAYKKGLNKDTDGDELLKLLKNQLAKPSSEGGAGLSLKEAETLAGKTFAGTLPGTTIANIETAVKSLPKGAGMRQPGNVSDAANKAAIEAEKTFTKTVDDAMSKITGINYKKLPPGTTLDEISQGAYNAAKLKSENNAIRLTDYSETWKNQWNNLSKKYTIKNNPEEQNFNVVIQKFLEPIKQNNYVRANSLRGELENATKDVFVKIPKTTVQSESPAKIFTTTSKDFQKKLNFLKKGGIPKKGTFEYEQMKEYESTINTLNRLKGQFQTGKQFRYAELENATDFLEDTMIKTTNKDLAQSISSALFTINRAKSSIFNKLPNASTLIGKQSQFVKDKTILRDNVLGSIVNDLKGLRGPVSQGQALRSPDQFSVLFGNSQEQRYATKYLGSFIKGKDTGKLIEPQKDELKKVIYDRFIRDTSPDNPKAITSKEWLKKYGDGISDIFDKSEMSNLRTLVSAKRRVEAIETKYADLNFKLKNTIPFFKDVPIDQLEPFSIVNALYNNPDITAKQVGRFFSSIGKEQKELIQTFYMQKVFNSNKSRSAILDKDTLDGGKLFDYFSNEKNEKIFSNIMGPTATKNFKVLSAALDLMQRPNRYLGKEMTKAQQDEVRSAATRMIYGPLSHENILIKGSIFFLNKLDTKLGRELFDYDFFIEKFKNSYAFKYAPALNDKKFLGYFNTFDSGTTKEGFQALIAPTQQKFYTGAVGGIGGTGTEMEFKYDFEEETGLPTFPVIQTIIGAPFKAAAGVTKTTSHGLDKLINFIESDTQTKKKITDFEKFEKRLKEDEKEKSN
jgi:hypothetical protein